MQTHPQYNAVRTVSTILASFAVLTFAGSIIYALATFIAAEDKPSEQGFALVMAVCAMAGGALVAAFYYGAAEVLLMIRDIAINSFKAIDGPGRAPTSSAPSPEPEDLSDFRPEPRNPDAPQSTIDEALGIGTRVSTLKPADLRKVVVCSLCSARIGIPASSDIKTGDRIKCPKCGAANVVG